MVGEIKSSIPGWTLAFGVLFSVMVSTTVALGQSAHRRAAALHRSQSRAEALTERLELATGSARIGIWDWNVRANSLVWSDEMYAIYGVERDRFAGAFDAWQAGLHPDDKERASAAVDAALKEDRRFNTSFRIVHPDGAVKHIQAHGVVQRDGHGPAVRMLGVNWDITDIKEAEELQRRMNEQLEARVAERTQELESSNRDLESFAYVASHDLQEPLRKIRTFSDLLAENLGDDLNEESERSLNVMTSAAARMAALIDDLLIYARAGNRELELRLQWADTVVDEIVRNFSYDKIRADLVEEFQFRGPKALRVY